MAFGASFFHPRWPSVLSFTVSLSVLWVCGSHCLSPVWPLIKGVNFLKTSLQGTWWVTSLEVLKILFTFLQFFSVSECLLLEVTRVSWLCTLFLIEYKNFSSIFAPIFSSRFQYGFVYKLDWPTDMWSFCWWKNIGDLFYFMSKSVSAQMYVCARHVCLFIYLCFSPVSQTE